MDSNEGEKRSASERIAKIISVLSLSPFQIVLYISFAGIICDTILEEWLLNTVSGVFFLLIPFIAIIYTTKKKKVEDSSIALEDRFKLLFIQIVGFIAASIFYYLYPSWTGLNTEILFIFTVGYTILNISCLIVTSGLKHKTSLHMTGATSSITGLVMVFWGLGGLIWGLLWGLLYLSCIPIAWARWKLRSHTVHQIVSGTTLGIGIIVLTYLAFWYLF